MRIPLVFQLVALSACLPWLSFADQGPSKADSMNAALANPRAALELSKMEFNATDANHDGFITKDEMRARASAVFDLLDADHDGKLSKEEFRALPALLAITMMSKSDKVDAERVDAFFNSLDKKRDGKIERDQLISAFVADFATMDANKDGKVSSDEFLVFRMRRTAQSAQEKPVAPPQAEKSSGERSRQLSSK